MNLNIRPCHPWLIALCVLASLVPAFDAVAAPKRPPTISTQPQDLVVITGDAASFSVAATGTEPLYYQWRKNGAPITGATAATYSLATVTSNDAADYDVEVSNAYGTVTSSVATLTVYVPPWFTLQPTSLVVTNGGNAVFTVAAQGIPTPALQWYSGANRLLGQVSSTLSLTNVQTNQAGSYYCVATNVAGSVTSAVAVLTVLVPPGITAQPQTLSVTNGNPASFSVIATGTSPLTYQWRKNTAKMPGATNATFTLAAATTNDAAGYDVVVTNVAGAVTSAVATLTVYVPPWFAVQPTDQAVTLGSNAVFTAGALGIPTPALQWFFGTNRLPGGVSSTLSLTNVQASQAGSYYCVATNAAGSATSSVATLTVGSSPIIITQPQSRTNVAGTAATFTAAAGGTPPLTYEWRLNGLNLVNDGRISGATTSTLQIAGVQPGDAGSYALVVSNVLGVVTSAVATLTVTLPPAINVSPASRSAVAGTSVSFSVSASGTLPLSYQWQFNGANIGGATAVDLVLSDVQPTNSGSYTVVVTNVAGSVTSAVAVLTVLVPPAITEQPASLTVIAGTNVSFSVTASGTEPLSYRWQFNGTELSDGGQFSGATGATLSISNVQPTNAGNYTVVITNVAGSAVSAVATLTVNLPGACLPSEAGLVSWWPGDGNANDIAGASNGTLLGGATAGGPGVVGPAFTFDGTNGYVQIPDSPVLRPTNLTVEAWVLFSSLESAGSGGTSPGQQYIVFKQNTRSSAFEGYNLLKLRGTGGDVLAFVISSALGQITELRSTSRVATGVWYHVAGVRGSNFVQIYVNGQRENQTSVSFAQDYGNYPLYFGTSGQTSWDRKLNGRLDEVSLYNRALSGDEIAAVYSAGTAGRCKEPNITLQPQSQMVAIGTSALFTVTASGFGSLSYQWRFNGANIASATSTSFTLSNVQPTNVGSYTVVVTNSLGSATSTVATLTVVCPSVTLSPASLPSGTPGSLYSQTLSASGGAAPYAYLATSGSLPPGLALSGEGVLSGTPTTVGSFSFIVRAADTKGCWGTNTYTVAVGCPAITVGPTTLPNGLVGNAYSQSLTTSGGSGPYTFAVTAGGLPAGLGVSGAGVLSGVPSAIGTNSFTVTATDSNGCSGSQAYSLAVTGGPPAITVQPVSLVVAAGNNASFGVTASGIQPLSYQWRFNGANLFDGGGVSGATTATLSLTGVQSTNAGNYDVVVTNVAGSVTSAVAILTVTPPTDCSLPPAGLVAWWPGDGSAKDIIGSNNGTLQGNAIANAPGFNGQAFSFDGTNDYVEIPDSPVFHPTNLTVECWVRFASYQTEGTSAYSNQQYIVFKQNSQVFEFEGFALTKDHDPQGDVFLWEVASPTAELIRIDSVSTVITGVWYHVVGVRGPDYVQLYKDGQLEAQTNVNFPQDYGNLPLYFGTSGQSYYDHRMHGDLDEVSLYDRALSASEIAALYAAGAAGKCKGTNGILITAQPQSQSVLSGSNVSFSVTATAATTMVYQWLFNGAPITGATNSSLALASVQATNAGSYKVVITNPTSTKTSADAVLTVNGPPLLLNARTTANGTFAFTLSGAAGLAYVIEITTNFLEWGPLASLTNITGQTDFIDATSSNSVARAYRARLTH